MGDAPVAPIGGHEIVDDRVVDERAAVKKRINVALGSTIVEEKSYAKYR